MKNASDSKRKDTASRIIKASPHAIYQAFIDPQAIVLWRPPKGMKALIYTFEPREGGIFRMSFGYADTKHSVPGKTSAHADVFNGKFLKLIPDELIVELVEFESNDPAFAGEMTITTSLTPVPGGTEVTFVCENVPEGISPADHQLGMSSSLENLAAFTE